MMSTFMEREADTLLLSTGHVLRGIFSAAKLKFWLCFPENNGSIRAVQNYGHYHLLIASVRFSQIPMSSFKLTPPLPNQHPPTHTSHLAHLSLGSVPDVIFF
jgi:hypothetical protein